MKKTVFERDGSRKKTINAPPSGEVLKEIYINKYYNKIISEDTLIGLYERNKEIHRYTNLDRFITDFIDIMNLKDSNQMVHPADGKFYISR